MTGHNASIFGEGVVFHTQHSSFFPQACWGFVYSVGGYWGLVERFGVSLLGDREQHQKGKEKLHLPDLSFVGCCMSKSSLWGA